MYRFLENRRGRRGASERATDRRSILFTACRYRLWTVRPSRAGWVGLLRSIGRSLSVVGVQEVVMYQICTKPSGSRGSSGACRGVGIAR